MFLSFPKMLCSPHQWVHATPGSSLSVSPRIVLQPQCLLSLPELGLAHSHPKAFAPAPPWARYALPPGPGLAASLPPFVSQPCCPLLRQVFSGFSTKIPLLFSATSPCVSFMHLFSCLFLLYYNSISMRAGTFFNSASWFFNLTVSVSPVAEAQVSVTSHVFSCFASPNRELTSIFILSTLRTHPGCSQPSTTINACLHSAGSYWWASNIMNTSSGSGAACTGFKSKICLSLGGSVPLSEPQLFYKGMGRKRWGFKALCRDGKS